MTAARHLELLVEEQSVEAFLRALLPRLLPERCTFQVYPFQGKGDLLGKLVARLAQERSTSRSFRLFCNAIREVTAGTALPLS